MFRSILIHVACFSCLLSLNAREVADGQTAENELFARRWVYASETSAIIYWQFGDLESDGVSFVEYGTSDEYGERTGETEIERGAHFHRLRGLRKDTVYHYRMVVTTDSTRYTSQDRTFSTRTLKDAVYLPGTQKGTPLVLDVPGATYVLTKDIEASGTAIVIEAADVTLDLDGHTVIFGDDTEKQSFGVHIDSKGPAVVGNGHIVQGRRSGNYSSGVESRNRAYPAEVFGISTDVHLPNAYPMRFFGRCVDTHLHHNALYSRVTELESRHYPGNDLLRLDDIGDGVHVHDNLLTEGCHVAMRINGGANPPQEKGPDIHHNDIKHHQQYVNGYAIAVSCPGADIYRNRVTSIGRGVHLLGPDLRLHDNYLDIRGHMTLDDMPQNSRPFQERRIELHGIKLEGSKVVRAKVYHNFMRITQRKPDQEWDYVPATPLNVACRDPNAMNEVYGNTFVALTEYTETHHGEYGSSGQWASSIHFVGMTREVADKGKFSVYIYGNTFISNDVFVSAGWNSEVSMTVRIENNSFELAEEPEPTTGHTPFRGIGSNLIEAIQSGENTFDGM